MNKYSELLQEGMVFKNYKALCEHIKEDVVTGGRNRKLQENKWLLGFQWEKDGQKYIITEIPEDAMEFTNKGNSVFKDAMSLVILNILARSKVNPYIKTRKELITGMGLVNPAFYEYDTNPSKREAYAETNNHMFFSVNDYFDKANTNNRARLKRTLESLAKKDFIIWKNSYMFVKFGKTPAEHTYRHSTEEEEVEVMNLRRDLLTRLNYDSLEDVFKKGEQDEFFDVLNPIINDRFDINASYPMTSISYNLKLILEYLEPRNLLLSDRDLALAKARLNNLAVDRIIELAENKKGEFTEANKIFFENLNKDRDNEKKLIMDLGKDVLRSFPDYYEATVELTEMAIKDKRLARLLEMSPCP